MSPTSESPRPSAETMLGGCCEVPGGRVPAGRVSRDSPGAPTCTISHIPDTDEHGMRDMTVGFITLKAGSLVPAAALHLKRNKPLHWREAAENTPMLANVCADSMLTRKYVYSRSHSHASRNDKTVTSLCSNVKATNSVLAVRWPESLIHMCCQMCSAIHKMWGNFDYQILRK